ncbi:tryptophan 7-halogenase [Duganella sp. FT135W]|uniref:Tryptophan 7-halogenase n=1 Tax=Duganella flavida TaxID=2692175 RepID=A0A6L8KG07_9BURK|nr:tryptophan halogenase family protein [Duganella flavida]MYM24734.1 tryptophan 7-halogenase [Duganella flavida]
MNVTSPPKKIIIVGGGSAGWMTALMYGDALIKTGVEITVLESPSVGVIGVGEGSTPALKRYFDSLGIAEAEWMPECHATYKSGITFDGWSTKPGYESYFHQFATMVDNLTLPNFMESVHSRQRGAAIDARPNRYFLSSRLSDDCLAPIGAENFPFFTTYGYHFDATLLGQFLHKRAAALGVQHKVCHVTHAVMNERGDIAAVATQEGEQLAADFFIDCSGFSALLIGKTLETPFVSYADNLFNDSAIAMPSEIGDKIPTQTVSTAMQHGWAWKIPLTNRFGNGYVYSSSFVSADQAEHELRAKLGLLESDTQARHLKMKLGRVTKHWNRNVLAVGLSQGFLEPLEATALYLTQMTAAIFLLFLEKGDLSEKAQDLYNQEIHDYFDGHRDYIVAHYKTNSRTDTPYWRANAENLSGVSDSLKHIFQTWIEGKDLVAEVRRQNIERFYPIGSWYALLAGMGTFPAIEGGVAGDTLAPLDDFMRRCALNFRDHRTVLDEMAKMRNT